MGGSESAGAPVMVFGADTDPGYRLSQLARRAGVSVIAVLRQPTDSGLLARLGAEVAVADPVNRVAVDGVFQRPDAGQLRVVCFIGGSSQQNSQGNINVIDAAASAGVQRFVLTTSIGCGDSAVVLDPFVKAFAGKSIRAKDWAEKHLRVTGLAWSIVRSGGMTLRPGRGGPIAVESPHVVGYINRTDLGDVVWQVLNSRRAVGRVYAAVDRARAIHMNGDPVEPANLQDPPPGAD